MATGRISRRISLRHRDHGEQTEKTLGVKKHLSAFLPAQAEGLFSVVSVPSVVSLSSWRENNFGMGRSHGDEKDSAKERKEASRARHAPTPLPTSGWDP